MIGMGFSEFVILFILLGPQGNIGVPLGVPPAEEVQRMSNVAPERCLFYASWATAGTPDPGKNPTERWFAQPKIQAAKSLVFERLLRSAIFEIESDDREDYEPYARALVEIVAELSRQALQQATAIFVEQGEQLETLNGGCVIQLAQGTGDRIGELIRTLKESLPPDWKPRTFAVGDNQFFSFTYPHTTIELSIGVRGPFAIVGFGPDSIAKIEPRFDSPEPKWLSELKQKLAVERRCSISHIAIRDWYSLLKNNPQTAIPEEGQEIFEEILHIDSLVALDSICGLDSRGLLSRHRLTIEGKDLLGLAAILDAKPLTDEGLRRLTGARDFTLAVRFSIDHILSLIDQSMKAVGENFQDPLDEFRSHFDLDLKKDLLDYLDGSLFVEANFDTGDPTSGFLAQLGVGDEMSFFDSYTTFNEKLAELTANELPRAKFSTDEREGINVYTIDEGDEWSFFPQPKWFLQGGRVCFALDDDTIDRRIAGNEESLLDHQHFQDVLGQARQLGLKQPLGVTRIEMSALIKMLMSMSSMWGGALDGAPIQLTDLPPTEVLTNGLDPSVALLFRTEDGFEMYGRQTIPSSAPGASVAAIGVFAIPATLRVRGAAKRVESLNNMRQILIAIHNYHDANMALPAQFNKDKDGNPLLSWRVHILPYLDEGELYQQFHLDEPWDSEHNRPLIERIPHAFRHPKLDLEAGKTSYVAPVGKDTAWIVPKDDRQSPQGMTLEQISRLDGCSASTALIEVPADNAVVWTKPDDFDVDREDALDQLKPIWRTGINAAMMDGSVWTFKPDVTEEQWRIMFGIRDGQALDFTQLRSPR